ncbi:MAG: alanine/glycine:cation symporter family protein [Candidatus Neomarinimicrobiota bacterium]|jgi:AGCS family alanine or glycine:cation symporter
MSFAEITNVFVSLAWGPWLVFLLVGSGFFFSIFSRFIPFRNLKNGFKYLFQKDNTSEGRISKYEALSSALSGTIGLGNIAGVALAIQLAGPGAVFWMWMTACLGIATKFFTCSLSVMYREKDSDGTILGGPMYVIKNGLSSKWAFLAYLFAFFGMIGGLPAVQSNQMVQIISDFALPILSFDNQFVFNLVCGIIIALVAGTVIIGGLTRIAKASSWLVPVMGGLYILSATIILIANFEAVPNVFKIIFLDAFSGTSVAGGTLMGVIMYGIQRGAFSNEAGIGTEALIHGTAKTNNPIKQGFVAMIGPIFDTLLICTATAVVIILSGLWASDEYSGVSLTAMAFQAFLGNVGVGVVFFCVVFFGISTIFTYSYYGSVCARFLFGIKGQKIYLYIFISTIIFFASISLDSAINIIDGSFAMMAIPTLVSSIILAPKVVAEANKFLAR